MRVLFINPPIHRYDVAELAPPLALLTLQAAASRAGHQTFLTDLNLPVHREAADNADSFVSYVTTLALAESPDLVCVTSMGPDLHVGISIGQALSQLGVAVCLGGFHAEHSASWISACENRIVVRGTRAFQQLAQVHPWITVADSLGFSQSELLTTSPIAYFSANNRRVVNYEAGRGCKYKCSFCYSPAQNPSWTFRSPEDVARDFAHLASLGAKHVFVVDDNLLNSIDFIHRMASAVGGIGLTWNGYGTLLDIAKVDLDLLATAGCRDLYVGVESVSPRQQREWNKRYRDTDGLCIRAVSRAVAAGMSLTAAFILDLRQECDDETAHTLEVARSLAYRGAGVRLSVITQYPGTKLFAVQRQLVHSRSRCDILLDVPEVIASNPMAVVAPANHPWHNAPAAIPDWAERILAVAAAQALCERVADGILGCRPVLDQSPPVWQTALQAAKELWRSERLIHKVHLKQELLAAMLSRY